AGRAGDGRLSGRARPSARRRPRAGGDAPAAAGAGRRRTRHRLEDHALPADRGHDDPYARLRRRRPPPDGSRRRPGDEGGWDDAGRGDGCRDAAPALRLAAGPGAAQRAVRGARRHRPRGPPSRRADAAARANARRAGPARAPARTHAAPSPARRDPADPQRHPRARHPDATIVARLAVGAAAAWAAYAWGAHLFASGWVSRGPGTERRIALTFDDGPDPVSQRILGVLAQEQARASFFLVGER